MRDETKNSVGNSVTGDYVSLKYHHSLRSFHFLSLSTSKSAKKILSIKDRKVPIKLKRDSVTNAGSNSLPFFHSFSMKNKTEATNCTRQKMITMNVTSLSKLALTTCRYHF